MVALECEEFNKTNEQWNKKKPIKIIINIVQENNQKPNIKLKLAQQEKKNRDRKIERERKTCLTGMHLSVSNMRCAQGIE